ncbi:12095_t:CDS:2, partial [Racocetra fulgida]
IHADLNKNIKSQDPEYINNKDFDSFNKLLSNNIENSQLQNSCSCSESQYSCLQSPKHSQHFHSQSPKHSQHFHLRSPRQSQHSHAQYDGLRKSYNEERADVLTQQ